MYPAIVACHAAPFGNYARKIFAVCCVVVFTYTFRFYITLELYFCFTLIFLVLEHPFTDALLLKEALHEAAANFKQYSLYEIKKKHTHTHGGLSSERTPTPTTKQTTTAS